ncbi:MAG: hypothetical protein LBD91_06770, partial [Prevotellaceae bacterium]|nr:hypothetical protein [Prevotellaceae bacterium]
HNPYNSGNDAPTEYDCLFEGDTCAFGADNSYTLTMPDSGNVTVCVRVINAHGCVDSACVTIGVIQAPPAAPVLAGGGTYCGNASLSCFGETGYSYQLQVGSMLSVGATQHGANAPLDFPITTTGAYTYTVVATDTATGCTAVSNAQALTVNALPAAPTGASNNSRCGSGTVTFSATPPTGCTIDWYNAASGGSTVTDGYGVSSFASSITATTTYYAQARDNTTGCVSATRLPVTATVHPDVAAAVISGNASNTCPAITVTLTATAAGATTFTWYRNGSQVQSSTSNAYTATSSGNYTVQGKNANCTGNTSALKVVTISACRDVPGCNGLELYQTTSAVDGKDTWSNANTYCTNRGARLPNLSELRCMCENKATLPGGYSLIYYYWTSNFSGTTSNGDLYYTIGVDVTGCVTNKGASYGSFNFRCVL